MGAGKGKVVNTKATKKPVKFYEAGEVTGTGFFSGYTKDEQLNDLLVRALENEEMSAMKFMRFMKQLGYSIEDITYLTNLYEVRTGIETDYDGDNDEHLLISDKLKKALGKSKIVPVVEDANAPTTTNKQKITEDTPIPTFDKPRGRTQAKPKKEDIQAKEKAKEKERANDKYYTQVYDKNYLPEWSAKNSNLVKKYNTAKKIKDAYSIGQIDRQEMRMLLLNINELMLAALNSYKTMEHKAQASSYRTKMWDEATDGKLTAEQKSSQLIQHLVDQEVHGKDKLIPYLMKTEGYGVKLKGDAPITREKPAKGIKDLPNTATAKKNAKEVEDVLDFLINKVDSPLKEKYKRVVYQLGDQSRASVLGRCGVSAFSERDTIYLNFYNTRLGIANDADMWNSLITNNIGNESFESNWNTVPGTIGVVAHEFGHAVEHYVSEMLPNVDYYRDFGLSCGSNSFSRYSRSMPSEAFAEAFSMYACGIEPQYGTKENWEKFRKKMKQYGFDKYEGSLAKYVPDSHKKYLYEKFSKDFRRSYIVNFDDIEDTPKPKKSSVKKKVKDRVDNVRKQQAIDEIFKTTPVTETPKKAPKPKEEPKQEDRMATLIAKYSKYKTTSTLTKDYKSGKITQTEYENVLNALGKNTKSVKEAEPPKPKATPKKTSPKKDNTPVKEQKKPTTSKKVEPTKKKNGQRVTNTYSDVGVDEFNKSIDDILKRYNK